jgi:hypothetical protein
MKTIWIAALLAAAAIGKDTPVLIYTQAGEMREALTAAAAVKLTVGGVARVVPIGQVLSIHLGSAASEAEGDLIRHCLTVIQGADRGQRDVCVEKMTMIGVPAVTPLLEAYKDTDQHEPRPLYRLFARVMPAVADGFDRRLAVIRLATGETLRGTVEPVELPNSRWDEVRMLAVRQRQVTRNMDVHSILHSTRIEYLDTGVVAVAASKLEGTAKGFTRLAFAVDGWASGPDGLEKPGPNYKTNLVDGHPFGALVGRVGAQGEVFFCGSKFARPGPAKPGRLGLAVNDNRHWQNNLGAYRVSVRVSEAYDVGEAQ